MRDNSTFQVGDNVIYWRRGVGYKATIREDRGVHRGAGRTYRITTRDDGDQCNYFVFDVAVRFLVRDEPQRIEGGGSMLQRTWPAPLLQPDPAKDCLLYSLAYICHCAGYPQVSVEDIRRFRAEAAMWAGMFPTKRCGLHMERIWEYLPDESERLRFWMGPGERAWVEEHLCTGKIGLVCVERAVGHAHQLVVLESLGDAGVLVMDPLYGHREEPWDWFLSVGPGHTGCHHIDGWYSVPESRRHLSPDA